MRRIGFIACFLALASIAFAREPEATGLQHWAVLASAEIASTPLPELLAVRLAQDPDIDVVERQKIDELIDGAVVAELLGAPTVAERARLGQMVGADALVLLGIESIEDTTYVRVVISDCHYGARLAMYVIPYRPSEVENLVQSLHTQIDRLRGRFAEGVKRLYGVPPFLSRSLTHDLDHLQRPLARLLETNLLNLPNTAVLEMEEAQAIRQEQLLAGAAREERVTPWFAEGEYRLESMGTNGAQVVRLTMRVTDGRQVLRQVEKSFADAEAMIRYVRQGAMAELADEGAASGAHGMTTDEQVGLLRQRAEAFVRLGSTETAGEMLEAALLIQPDNADVIVELTKFYIDVASGESRPMSSWDSAALFRKVWRARCAAWHRAVDIVDSAIRRQALTRTQAARRGSSLNFVLFDLGWDLKGCTHVGGLPYDEATNAAMEAELARIGQRWFQFRDGVFMSIWDLPPGDETPRALTKAHESWLTAMFDPPDLGCHGLHRSPVTAAELERLLHALDDFGPHTRASSITVTEFIVNAAYDPDFPRAFSDTELAEFYSALEQSSKRLNRLYGRMGRILFDYFRQPTSERPSAATTLAEMEKVVREIRDHVIEDERLVVNVPIVEWTTVKTILRADAEAKLVDRARPHRLPSKTQERDADLPPLTMSWERVWMKVRDAGGHLHLMRKLYWADQPGYGITWGFPDAIIPIPELGVDVLWNEQGVYLHREPGILDPVVTFRWETISDVCWDGEHIWVAQPDEGLTTYDGAGRLQHHIGESQGLPPSEHALHVAPLNGGGILASGAFGVNQRGWIALVQPSDSGVKVSVIHEATRSPNSIKTREERRTLAEMAFAPRAIVPYRPENRAAPEQLLVLRKDDCDSALLVDVAERKVRRTPLFPDLQTSSHGLLRSSCPISRPDGGLIVCDDYGIYASSFQADTLPANCPHHIFKYDDAPLTSMLIQDGDIAYAPGRRWVQVDLKSLRAAEIGVGPLAYRRSSNWRCYGKSVHYGLLGWSTWGEFYEIDVQPASQEASANAGDDSVGAETFEQHIATFDAPLANALRESLNLAFAGLHFHNACGLWPQRLEDMAPRFIERIPPGWTYTWGPCQFIVAQRPLDDPTDSAADQRILAYVYNGYERGWYLGTPGSFTRLELPPQRRHTDPLGREEMIANTLAELDRRILREPDEQLHLRMKVWYLYELGRLDEARDLIMEWIRQSPSDLEARQALFTTLFRYRSGRRLCDATRNLPAPPADTYASWRLFHFPSQGESQDLWGALQLPFANDRYEWAVAEMGLLEDADWLLLPNKYGTIIDLCARWEAQAEEHTDWGTDHSFLYYRAAAHLGLGEYDKALEALTQAGRISADSFVPREQYQALRKAIEAHDQSFDADCTRHSASDQDWRPVFHIALPPDE